MVNPVVTKIPVKPPNLAAEEGQANPARAGESKFDQVRARLLDEKAKQVEIPPEIKQVSLEQKKVLETNLSRRLAQTRTQSTHEIFAADMKGAKQRVEHLTKRVNALPKTPAFEPFRSRLSSIDAQYQSAGQLVNSVKGTESQADLMKIQVHMYQLTENLELMSKVVEQVTSGVKSILQTQV